MKVVITGAKGFIGRELISQCKEREIEVIGIDIIESSEKNYYKADITSKEISKIIPEGIDAIIHLAALSRDPDCRDKAYECFNINVMGTLNLIEAAQKKNVKQFIFASSEWVYDNFTKNEIKNEDSIINIANNKSEYALSKLVSEANLWQKYQNGFCPITILRFGIVYGPRKEVGSAVESLFRAVKEKDEIEVGSLKTGRHFIHVSDIVSGIIKSIGLPGFNIINLEGDKLITLGDIIEVSKKILNKNPIIIEKAPESTSIRRISNEKAKKLLNWNPDKEFGDRTKIIDAKNLKTMTMITNNTKSPNVLFVHLLALPFKFIQEIFIGKASLSETLAMPLGILYLSSYLKANNQLGKIGLLDYPLNIKDIVNYADIKDYILGEAQKQVRFKPDIICISLMFSTSYPFFKLVVELLKNLWPEAIIIVGGVHATNCVEIIMTNTKVDYVLRGEGEIALLEIVKQYGEKRPIKVKGLYSKDDIGGFNNLELAEQIENLDILPFPAWDLLDMEKYCTALGRRRPMDEAVQKRVATIMTTRGCSFRCTFCSAHTVHGRRVRFRSVESIIQEIKTLHQKYGITLFIPEDDLFTADPKRLLIILQAIKGLNIPSIEFQFPNSLHINTTTEDVIDALIECGTKVFTFAVESGSEYVQKNIIKKNCNLEKARALVNLCHEKGAVARCYFVIGFPGETKELLQETYQYIKTLDADWSVINIATPLVGSEMYEQFLKRGDINNNEDRWAKTFFTERDFDTEEISAEELNEFGYRANLDVNFINNVNLRNGNFDRAISLFRDILCRYPLHIFAYYGLYLAYKGKKKTEEAEKMLNKMHQLITKDKRAKYMYEKYGDLLPLRFKVLNKAVKNIKDNGGK